MPGRALLASPFGFLVGVSLGALGGGGSILAVPVLVFVAGQTPTRATSTSLVVVGAAALAGTWGHWRAGRVEVRTGVVFGLVGVAGSFAGSALNRRLDADALLLAFAGLILVAAWRIASGCPSCTNSGERGAVRTTAPPDGEPPVTAVATAARTTTIAEWSMMAAAGTLVGFLTGLFGVGGGFVIVPALALVLRFSMPKAVGTSLLVISINTALALAARLATDTIDWSTTVFFAAAAIAGVGVGKRIADRLDAAAMQRSFAAVLVVLALYTGVRSLSGL